jgi:hypothetical protein
MARVLMALVLTHKAPLMLLLQSLHQAQRQLQQLAFA